MSRLETAGSWDGHVVANVPPPAQPPPADSKERISITDALNVYLANREATVKHRTFRKYKTFTKPLQTFADSFGYVMFDQFRPADVDIFSRRANLVLPKAKMLERLRGS